MWHARRVLKRSHATIKLALQLGIYLECYVYQTKSKSNNESSNDEL